MALTWLLYVHGTGVVRSIKVPGERHHHLASIHQAEPSSNIIEASGEPNPSPAVDTCASAVPHPPASAADGHSDAPNVVQLTFLDGTVVNTSRANSVAARCDAAASMQQLRQQLAEKEAEIFSLKQRMQRLAAADAAGAL